ncbi:MAG: TolC family protein [Phycisphaerales bacterium]|nr:MAG: TolC family protein [Phycisphaerales bacterium]
MRIWFLMALAVYLSGLTGCASMSADQGAEPEFRADGPLTETSIHTDTPEPIVNEPGESDGPLSLSQAISLVLTRSLELRSCSWDLRAADARQVQAGLRPNPELGVSLEEFGGKGDRDGFDGVETTVAVTQPLELAGKRDKRTKVAAAEKQVVQWDHEATRLDLIRRTQRAFTAVLATQQRVDLTENQTDLAEGLWQTVNKRVDAGKDPPSEASKAQIELSKVRMQHQQAVSELTDARHRLAALWESSAPRFERIEGDLGITPSLPSLDLIRAQIETHPQVARWQDALAVDRARLDLARVQSRSDIAVTAGLKRLELDDDTTGVVGVAIPLPVFNRNQGAIAATQHELAKTREQRNQAIVQMQTRLAQAYQRLQTAIAQVSALNDQVLPGAESVFEAAQNGYEEGKFDYLRLLDAQRTLFDAQDQLVDAWAKVHLLRADLEYLIGQPINSFSPTDTGTER